MRYVKAVSYDNKSIHYSAFTINRFLLMVLRRGHKLLRILVCSSFSLYAVFLLNESCLLATAASYLALSSHI